MRLILLFLSPCLCCFAQIKVHPNAHAHNDYEHSRPLLDALSNGFASVEADVYLIDNRLLVSHDRPMPTSTRTLEALYLKPLDSIVSKNNGWVYPGHKRPLWLMIDFKTNGMETFNALRVVLNKYKHLLYTPGHAGAVRVFISGNRPIELIKNDSLLLASIDGRPSDLGKGYTETEMPVISDSFNKIMSWNGKGSPSETELNKLRQLARQAHSENKKLRLWASPDDENAWGVLLDSGVDFINTDKLGELNTFLAGRQL